MLRSLKRLANPLLVLIVADFGVIFASLIVAVWIRFQLLAGGTMQQFGPIAPRAASFAFWVMAGLVTMGLYRARQRPTLWEGVARVLVAVVLGGVADVLFFYLVPALDTGRGVMAISMAGAFVLLSCSRVALLRWFDANSGKRRVLVVGSGRIAARLAMLRRRADRRRFEVVGYVPGCDAERELAERLGLAPLMSEIDVGPNSFDEVVVALDDRRGNFPTVELLGHRFRGIPVVDIVDFLERETGRIDLDVMRPGWLVFAASRHTAVGFRVLKRVLDVAASSCLLVLVTPLFLATIVGVWLEDGIGAPLLYRQRRVGQGGRVFELLKFRSMRRDAEKETGPQWAAKRDDRVTRTGRIIRRFRIDELPQLVNIVRGDMSMVGPRPERPEFVDKIVRRAPLFDYRHCLRPGLAGWAQLNYPYGASVEDANEKLKYDLFYIKNATIVLDLFILLQTVEVVLWGRAISMAGQREASEGARSDLDTSQLSLFSARERDVA
jgi:sugar transferase (PEP-CTERM system associated)